MGGNAGVEMDVDMGGDVDGDVGGEKVEGGSEVEGIGMAVGADTYREAGVDGGESEDDSEDEDNRYG